jgi:hypothetical protein
MKTIPSTVLLLAGCASLATAGLLAAHAVGAHAFAKRADTALLLEPSPLATPAARVKLGARLKVEEVRGHWLRVSGEQQAAGWIFAGNVGAEAPGADAGLAALPLDASATTASAAARPLAPAAVEYGTRRSLAAAQQDLDWLLGAGAQVTNADVTGYLQANRKGEFQ